MRILKKIIIFIMISIFLSHTIECNAYTLQNTNIQTPTKVAVFLSNFNSPFISNLKKNLEDIQKENKNNFHFTFFDSKANQVIENENIEKALHQSFDLYVVDLVNSNLELTKTSLSKIFNKKVPLIITLLPNEQLINFIKTYNRAVIIGADDAQSGNLQGEIITDTWNDNKGTLDKNKDNIIQYIMLKGPVNDPSTSLRTKYSVQAINDAGIKTQELSSPTCNWDKECARTTMESLFLTLGNKVELIISNNDAMAIGAIEAIQKYGFNKGGNSKYIPVVGIDAIPEAQELINQGFMTGSVVQDTSAYADAIYTIGMNMLSGNNPLNGTNYKFDETGIAIKLPYYKYTK